MFHFSFFLLFLLIIRDFIGNFFASYGDYMFMLG